MKEGQGSGRRRWLAVGVGLAAGAAGIGFAGWQHLRSSTASADQASASYFWSLSFEGTDGGQLQAASFRGKPLLLNFWATWCGPCVKEMPLLDRFARESGWQVLGLAIDQPAPVREFLQRIPVAFPIALAGTEGVNLTRQLGNAGGQLPYSVVFNSAGGVSDRHLGAVDEAMLASWVANTL